MPLIDGSISPLHWIGCSLEHGGVAEDHLTTHSQKTLFVKAVDLRGKDLGGIPPCRYAADIRQFLIVGATFSLDFGRRDGRQILFPPKTM